MSFICLVLTHMWLLSWLSAWLLQADKQYHCFYLKIKIKNSSNKRPSDLWRQGNEVKWIASYTCRLIWIVSKNSCPPFYIPFEVTASVIAGSFCYVALLFFEFIFNMSASYQNSQGGQNENDPNNTTVGTTYISKFAIYIFWNVLLTWNDFSCRYLLVI